MFDFDAGKLLVFGAVALIVIGPKDLPRALRAAGKFAGQVQRLRAAAQRQVKELMDEADLGGVAGELRAAETAARSQLMGDPSTARRGRAAPSAAAAADAAPTFASPEMQSYLAALAPSEGLEPTGSGQVGSASNAKSEPAPSATAALANPVAATL